MDYGYALFIFTMTAAKSFEAKEWGWANLPQLPPLLSQGPNKQTTKFTSAKLQNIIVQDIL